MAKFDVKMPNDYLKKLSGLSIRTRPMCEKAVLEGAGIIADKIRANASNVLSSEATGEMMDSFGVTPPDIDDRGVINAKVGFDSYDSKGNPNPLKANALESGRVQGDPKKRKHTKRTAAEWARAVESGTAVQPKRPFIRPAVNATKKKANDKMAEVIDEEIQKIMK